MSRLYWASAILLLGLRPAAAAAPRIDHIEPLFRDQVTIHFYTEPFRVYTLQYMDSLNCPSNNPVARCNSNGVPTNLWVSLFVAPSLAFSNHYVVSDVRTNVARYYRLKAKP